MPTNKYPGPCEHCGQRVPAQGGTLRKEGRRWIVAHLSCGDTGTDRVIVIQTSGGTFYQNKRGRCEDAPCCGCCTI